MQAHIPQIFCRSNKQETKSPVDHNIFTLEDRVNFSACIKTFNSNFLPTERKTVESYFYQSFIIAIDQQRNEHFICLFVLKFPHGSAQKLCPVIE